MIYACVAGYCLAATSFFAVEVRDLDFMLAQEAFVVQQRPMARPPEHVRDIFDQIEVGQYCERQAASQRLLRVDPRWLYYGVTSRDAEIRLRCDAVLRIRAVCKECKSSGLCMGMFPPDSHPSKWKYGLACLKCDGRSWAHEVNYRSRSKCTVCNGKMLSLRLDQLEYEAMND